MSTPSGWYPDQSDPRVQRFWTGSAWTAQRFWNGAEWVDAAPPPQFPPSAHPSAAATGEARHKGGGRRWWWIAAAAAAVVVVVVSVAAAGGGSGNGTSRATFCADLQGAMSGLYGGNVVHVVQGGSADSYSAAELTSMRAAISSAKHLAGEAPDGPKQTLEGLARGLTAHLNGRADSNLDDDVDIQLGRINAWHATNC